VGVALFTTPIGWFLLGVAAIAAAAFLIYKNWEPIAKFFTDLWEGVKGAFGAAIDWISAKISALTGLIANAIVKLNALQPEWLKRFTLPGAALNALASAVAPAVAPQAVPSAIAAAAAAQGQAPASGTAAAGVQQTNVGGTIRIEIDQQGRARVASLTSDNRDVDLEVYSGQMMMTP